MLQAFISYHKNMFSDSFENEWFIFTSAALQYLTWWLHFVSILREDFNCLDSLVIVLKVIYKSWRKQFYFPALYPGLLQSVMVMQQSVPVSVLCGLSLLYDLVTIIETSLRRWLPDPLHYRLGPEVPLMCRHPHGGVRPSEDHSGSGVNRRLFVGVRKF